MAIIKLDENYNVSMDAYNFTLKFEIKNFDENKQKEVTTKDEWHFPSFDLAISKYLNECIKPLESVLDLYEELNRIEKLISTLKK